MNDHLNVKSIINKERAVLLRPANKIGSCSENIQDERSVPFGSAFSSVKLSSNIGKLKLPADPSVVLDAPGLLDDFYLNLLDWSPLSHHPDSIIAVGLQGCTYLWNSSNSRLCLLCKASGALVGGMNGFGGEDQPVYVSSVRWLSTPGLLAIALSSGIVQVWDTKSTARIAEFDDAYIEGLSSIESLLADGDALINIPSPNRVACIAATMNDSNFVATGCRLGTIRIYDAGPRSLRTSSPSLIRQLSYHQQEVCGLEFSSSPSHCPLLASGSNDNTICIWDARWNLRPIYRFTEHNAAVKVSDNVYRANVEFGFHFRIFGRLQIRKLHQFFPFGRPLDGILQDIIFWPLGAEQTIVYCAYGIHLQEPFLIVWIPSLR